MSGEMLILGTMLTSIMPLWMRTYMQYAFWQ